MPEPDLIRGRAYDDAPAWPAGLVLRCEYCGQFYGERTAKAHAECQQAEDRRIIEGTFG
jgi:hypothetical protein